jgi:hypothetical protein
LDFEADLPGSGAQACRHRGVIAAEKEQLETRVVHCLLLWPYPDGVDPLDGDLVLDPGRDLVRPA